MGAGTRSFQDTEGNVYDLKENEVNDFLNDFPDATEVKSFVAGKDTFDIPLNEVADFQKDYPDAKPLGQPAEAPAPSVKKKGESTTATPSSSLDIDKELKGKISDKDLYDYKQSRDRGIMGQTYIAELKKKNPAIAEFEAKEAAVKATAPSVQQIKERVTPKKSKKELGVDLNKIIKKENETNDAYVERMNLQKKADEQVKKEKEKAQFVANEDFIAGNTTEGYLEYLRTNYPDKWEEIQTKKASGVWNRGADVEEEAKTLTEHPFAGPAMVAAMRGKAFFTGETNQADDAAFYLEANNWAAKTQQDILGDIEKTDAFKQYKALTEQLNASPVGQQLKPINEGLEKISKSKDFLEYQNLSQKGQKQNGKLSEQDYKRYQELAKTKDVAAFIELSKGRDQILGTPEGQQYAQAATQVQQLQGTKEIAQYFKTAQNLQKTVGNLKAFATKFPKQFLASQIYENYQKQSDNVYKKMPVFLKSAFETLDAATDTGMQIVGDISTGVLKLAATGQELVGMESAAKFTNSLAGGITQLTEDLSSYYAPSSTQLQLPFFDSYVPYKLKGQSVRLYKNDKGDIIDVRDRDGYSMFLSQDDIQGIDKMYQQDPNKPQEVGDYMGWNGPAKVSSTLVTLAGIYLTGEAGAALQLPQKTTMFSYGYLTSVNGAYEAIKKQDPLISEDDAMLYANFVGILNGGLFTVTPQSLLGKEAVETGYKEIGSQYINLLRNGLPRVKALTKVVGGQIVKHGGEGALFGMGMETVNKVANAATNEMTGRQSVDDEFKLSQMLESGGSMFIASTLMGLGRIRSYRDKAVGDALFTGLKNYDKTLADFEQMANSGQITPQDFNRLTNLMSELKPIYDNLADMGEYNTQYKTALISLYAEKYQKQQELNAMDSGEQPGMIGKAVNKVKSVLTKGPMPNRDALVKELNDIDKSIESMAIVNNPDFIVYTTSAEEVAAEKIWSLQEVQAILKNPKIAQEDKDRVIDQFNKQTELIGQIVNKMMDPRTPLAERQKLYKEYQSLFDNTRFYKNEQGQFVPYSSSTLKIGKQYIFDPKSGKFLAIKGAVAEGPKPSSTQKAAGRPNKIAKELRLGEIENKETNQYLNDKLNQTSDPAEMERIKNNPALYLNKLIKDLEKSNADPKVINEAKKAYDGLVKEQAEKSDAMNTAVGRPEPISVEAEQEPKIIGAQVALPKYFSQGEQYTRDQLQQKLKDPAFIADLKAGRVKVDVFNDIEMESYIENLTKEKQAKERKLLQEGPRALGPGEQITPTEPGPAEVMPDLKLNQLGDKEVLTEDGTLATVERGEDGNWYLNLENGKSQQIPVTDNANPTETIKQLGLRMPVEQNVPVPVPQGQKEITGTPIDITIPTGQEVGQVTVADDGVTFNIPEVGQVTWLKFNYTNKGELKTADVMMPDGKKMKIKDTDIVYDMAVALSNQSRARLGVTPEVANGSIESIVDPIKQTFDKGMNAIYNVVVNAGDAAIHIEKAYEGELLTQQEQAAALDYLVTAANTINKIDTQNATEKQNIIEWLSEAYDQVSAAEVTMEGPSELGVTQQGAEGISAVKGEPSAPTKQRIVKHPEISGNTQRILKRVAGDQESIDALTNAIKAAYEAGTSPMEAAKQLGYAGEEYKRYLEPIIQDMKPEITEVEVKPEVKAEAQSIDEQFDAVWSGIQAIPQGAFGKEQTQPITAEQLKANATKPVVKWSSTELSSKGNLEVFDAIAQNNPELAPLMQEATDAFNQIKALSDKVAVAGWPPRGYVGNEGILFSPNIVPFPYRIYSQLYNSTNANRFENASKAIEDFKSQLQTAKEFLANPPSEAELARIKAQREAIVLARQQEAARPLTKAEPTTPKAVEPTTEAEKMAKPIALDVLKVETLFNNNGYDISIDYDNEAIITDKKTGKQVAIEELPENMQKAAEVYGEWVSNIEEMVGDPMEFVAKTRAEYEGELVPYEEVKPEALPEKGKSTEGKPATSEVMPKIILGGLNQGWKAVTTDSFDVRSNREVMNLVNKERSFAKVVDYKGKKYAIVGLSLEPAVYKPTEGGRDNYSFALAEFNESTPKNIVDILENQAKENIKNVYPRFSDKDTIKPITEKDAELQPTEAKLVETNSTKLNQEIEDLKRKWAEELNAVDRQSGQKKKDFQSNIDLLDQRRIANEFIQKSDGKNWDFLLSIKGWNDLRSDLQELLFEGNYDEVFNKIGKTYEEKVNEKYSAALAKLTQPTEAEAVTKAEVGAPRVITLPETNTEVGKPLRFEYIKNPEKAPDMGALYGQDVEPAGVYVNEMRNDFVPEKWESGIAKLKSPLVIEVSKANLVSWKNELSDFYDGKTGKELTKALQADGYDGIITKYQQGDKGEIIIFDTNSIEAPVAEERRGIQYIEGNPVGGTAEVGEYRPEFKNEIVQTGKETQVILPDGTIYKAVYVLAPIKSVLASHDPNNGFRKTEGYPVDTKGNTTNDRDYEKDNSAQADVYNIAANPNFDLYLDQGQSVNVGPPTITDDGITEAGSGRVIVMNLLSPSQQKAMGKMIEAKAGAFGFSPQNMEGLGVFRKLIDFNEPYSKVTSAKFNQSEGKTKSEADTSLTFGNSLNENARAKELLFNTVGAYDTMGDFFNNLAAKRLSKDIMVKNGLVAEKDINKFFDQNGNWTPTGKEIFKKGLFATLFDEDIVRLLDTEGNVKFMDKIAKEMPTLATNFKLPADVNLKEEVQQAIRLQSQFQSSGLPDMNTFLRNMPIFDKPSYEGVIMWSLMDMSTVRNNTFRGAIQSYTNSAEQAGLPSIFSDAQQAMGKADFMTLILNKVPYEERQIIKNAFANEGFGPRVEEQGSRYTRSMGSPRPKDGLGRYTRFGEEGTGGQKQAAGRVTVYRTTGTGLGELGVAHRGSGVYYAIDTPFQQIGRPGQVSEVEININPQTTIDLTTDKGQKTFADVQTEAKKRFDAIPENERGRNLYNDLIRDVAVERGYEGALSYIEPAAPIGERERIGREYVSYVGDISTGEYTPRVEEDRTEYGRMYYSKRGDSKSSINGFYDPYSVQGKSANLGMDANGILPYAITYERAVSEYNKFKDIKVFKTYDGKRCYLKIKAANGMYVKFNPFTAVPYTAGRGKIEANPDSVIPPATSPISEVVQPATPPADDVLPQAERDFKNQQLFFDFNDDVQSVEEPGGKYFGFVSAANKIRKMTNLSKNEQEYFELLKDQVRNQTKAGAQKLAELRDKIGNERAVEIQNNVVNDLVEHKLGRKLKEGEYATQTSTVKVSKDKYAVGKTKIESAADVAYIARMIEGESVENFLLYMLDENNNLTLAHISTGGIAGTISDPKVIADHIVTFKPKKIWIAHNHPGSSTTPSDKDITLTKVIKNTADSLGVELAGHVIVDFIDGKYSVVDKFGAAFQGGSTKTAYKGAEDEIPVYINGKAATFDWSSSNQVFNQNDALNRISDGLTALRAGENVKGGFLVLNRANVVIGHFYLTGVNDVQDIIKASSALGASGVITYGNFNNEIYPVETELPNGVKVVDHITYQSERFTSAIEEPQPVYDYTAVTMPRVEELVLPYDRNSSKLQQAVQQAMVDGFLKFDEVMFNLYDGHFDKDVIKMRKALDDIKDAYDTLSFENEDWIDSVSSIKEVSNFNVDNFLKSIQAPQKKKLSLRQQYDDFASWFEYNFPEARPYYKIEFDSQLGDAIFTVNGEPVQLNGEPISYSRWLNNAAIQKQWYGADKALVKNQPQMIWVDKDLTPTPKQYITDASYKLFPFQTHAVNAAIDYFEKGNRGFGLWDGQGVGKTREILAIANEMATRSGKPSLIITKSDNVIDQFKESAGAMALRGIEYKKDKDSGIIIGTYNDLVGGKVGKLSSYGTVVFDEAHLLKNVTSKRSMAKEDIMQKMDHVVFATGTPMDKPSQLLYFAKYLTGENLDASLAKAGLKQSAGKLYPLKGPYDVVKVKKGLLNWRNDMIQQGAVIRREFPFYGTFGALPITIPEKDIEVMNQIIEDRGGRVGIMEANRYQEHLKIPYALERVNRALENGKQIVLFCTGVNPTEIKSMGITVPQFASEFSDILTKQGIAHSNIFGDNAAQKIEEAKKFQRGETKVAIATISSGGTGIDLDDQVGDAPREALFVTLPWSADDLDQAIRRVSRLNTKSPSIVDFIFADGSYPDEHKQEIVYGKMQTMRNVQAGVDPDLVEMNRWTEGDALEGDFEEPQIDEEGNVELAAPPITMQTSSEPYNPAQEVKDAEKGKDNTATTPITQLATTSQSGTNLGTSVPPAGGPRPPRQKSRNQKANEWLLGEKRTSIHAKILQAMIDLGVPTAGEYGYNKRWLGVYNLLSKDVKLRYSQDMFTAIHETMHWLDYSVMGGLTNDIINNGSHALRNALENLYLGLYPGAKDTHSDEMKISEGLAVFMQYKLHDPQLADYAYNIVEREVFSPGGRFYHPKMTEVYDAFRNILDDVQNMSSAGRVSQRIATETPFDDKFTVSGWNALAEEKAVMFDESYPLILWDEAAGDAHVLEASYLMWRRRGALAANIIKEGSGVLSGVSRPMYFAPNGQWTPLKYRMSDIVNNVVKVVKDNYTDIKRIYPEMTTSLDAFRTYLIARRVYYMGVKRVDLETQMANIIADAQQDFQELMTYAKGTPEYEGKLIDFNTNHIRPLRRAAEKWKEVNTIIDNEGGSVKDINPNFSPSLLAFEIPSVHGRITSGTFDNKKGNYISEHDVTEVFNSLHPYMKDAARMYDFINDKVGIDMAVATGLMSQEFANDLKFDNALYPGYASFQKHINVSVLENEDFVKINGGGTSKLRHTLRWKGSEYAIIDPVMSQASMVFEVFRRGMWNNTLLKLAQFSTLNDEFARGFMKLPTEYVPITTSSGTYLKPQVKGGEPKGVMVQKLYSNGKVKFYAVNDRALFHFFSSIADENKLAAVTNNKLYKFAQQLKVLFEKGTTGWYLFWPAKNLTVDQIQLLLTSSNSAIPVISTLRYGLPQMIGAVKDNAVKHMQTMFVLNKLFPNRTFNAQQMNYVALYLSMSGSSDSFFKQMESPEVVGALEKMFNVEEGMVPKLKKLFKGTVRKIDGTAMALTEITEILTKATELALAMKKGKDLEQAMLDAANLAPFYKRGSGRVLRAYQGTVPYLKPQFVMFYKTILEGYRKNPGKMMLVMDAMMGLGALSIFLIWESLTEDEKNYYRGLDGKTAAMYISIPSKLIGGKEGEISQYRVPEYIGSFNALGLMFAIAMLDNKELDQKQMTKTIASNIPSLINPYEYVASDKTILESVGTNFISNAPIPGKVLTEIWSDKKVTYYGRTPLTPRQTQSFPTEYQYKLGLGGTSSFAKYISDLSYNKVTPVQADLIMERTTGRTGKMIMDLFDNKELKNTFLKTREDVATNNKYYADFWSRYNEETGEFNVMRNVRYAAKIPKPGEPGYEDWKKEVRQKAETSEVYTSTHFMVMELLKMRDWARLSNNEIDVDVYNQMNRLMKDLYENKSNDLLMRDVHDAYRALKQEASRIRYESDVAQFNNYNDISKIDKYQIKLKTLKMIKGIK